MTSSESPRDDVKAFSHATPRDQLKKGDHIYAYRTGCVYAHHGIFYDEGSQEVIHFSGPKGFGSKSKVRISSVSLDEFCGGLTTVRLVQYGRGKGLNFKKLGTAHNKESRPVDDVISTATTFLKNPELWTSYNFFANNCEHFPYYCKTGSLQLNRGQSSIPVISPLCQYTRQYIIARTDQDEFKRKLDEAKQRIEEEDSDSETMLACIEMYSEHLLAFSSTRNVWQYFTH